MDQITHLFRRRTPVEKVIDSYANNGPEESLPPVSMPLSIKHEELEQPGGTMAKARRNPYLEQTAHESSLSSPPRPKSPTSSSRTVISRTSSGKPVRVQRPARDSVPDARALSRASQSSSVYSVRPERDTMTSTLTMVNAALADHQSSFRSSQRLGHSWADGSSTTIGSAAAISGTSGDIHIGHVEEVDEDGFEYFLNEHEEMRDCGPEQVQAADDACMSENRYTYQTCGFFPSRSSISSQHTVIDAQDYPIPPSYKTYSPREANFSWSYEAKLRAEERHALQAIPAQPSRKNIWTRRLVRYSSYITACCSIILPALFLVLGILMVFMDRKSTLSSWSIMTKIIEVAAALWPVVFAAVVAQCFKTWILYRAGRRNPIKNTLRGSGRLLPSSPRSEVMCILVFLVWCLSPFGSQGLERGYGSVFQIQQVATDLWYVDRTGYNTMWSANLTMPAASRSDLLQVVSERYISSLASSKALPGQNGPTTSFSLPLSMVSSSGGASDGSSLLLSSRDLTGNSASKPQALSFNMTVSHFNFTCGSWQTVLRSFDNTTSKGQMSYSTGQTLGLSVMTGDDTHTTSAGSVKFASLNKISNGNGTTMAIRDSNGTLLNFDWEYSSIQCEYRQYFYSVPVRCNPGNSVNMGACAQSATEKLVLTPVGMPGTELDDFAQDFVSANLLTTGFTATATEGYIYNGGPVDPTSLVLRRDDSTSLNLSASVSSDEFAQRFGHLFNTWVSLGYCPQCTSDVLAGNGTVIPTDLQSSYRQATATSNSPGAEVYKLNWHWFAVFLVFVGLLLGAAVTSVAVESMASTRPAARRNRRRSMWAEDDGEVLLHLPKACWAGTGRSSTLWGQGVMQDMEAAASLGYIYRAHV